MPSNIKHAWSRRRTTVHATCTAHCREYAARIARVRENQRRQMEHLLEMVPAKHRYNRQFETEKLAWTGDEGGLLVQTSHADVSAHGIDHILRAASRWGWAIRSCVFSKSQHEVSSPQLRPSISATFALRVEQCAELPVDCQS